VTGKTSADEGTTSMIRSSLSIRVAAALLAVPTAVAFDTPSALAAATGSGATGAAITNVHTVATFDYAAGGQPESITINPDGSLTVSLLGFLTGRPPELLHMSPTGQSTVLVTGLPGEAIGGNVRGRDGTIYYNVLSQDPARSGIWRLSPGCAPERIGALPAGQFLNGLTIDPARRNLYAADSLTGTIWTMRTSGGPVTAWLVDPALAPAVSGPGHFGVNGVEYHGGAVWASNTDRQTLLRIPVTATGAPGPVKVVGGGLTGIDDFKFLSDFSDVAFVALNGVNEIAVVYPDGTSKVVLTAADGLDSPTNAAIRGGTIYITDGGANAPHDAKLQVGKINFAALFAGGALS
jgi:hypothetical protein